MKYLSVHIITAMLLLNSCVVIDPEPTDLFTDENYWTGKEKADYVLNTAYALMFDATTYFNNEILSDNVYYHNASTNGERDIVLGFATSSNPRFQSEWTTCYRGIRTCNILLDHIDETPGITVHDLNRMKAETRFIRATFYYRLVNWYGDVPFYTHVITVDEAKTIAPTDKNEIINFVHDELDEIVPLLPLNLEQTEAERGRITAGAAVAYNARVYLYENDFASCAALCEELIAGEHGPYGLMENYADIFTVANEYNREVLLAVQYANHNNTAEKTWNQMANLAPRSITRLPTFSGVTHNLVRSYRKLDGTLPLNEMDYTNRDIRMDVTVAYNGSRMISPDDSVVTIYSDPQRGTIDGYISQSSILSSCTGYYYRKNYDPTVRPLNFSSGLDLILIRWADVLLMYAEAKNELGQMNAIVWDSTVKPIRKRAGFVESYISFPFTAPQQEIRDAIRQERRVELALEGLRVFDLRRWMRMDNKNNVLTDEPVGAQFDSNNSEYITFDNKWNYKYYYFGIPLSEKDINPNLGQNEGY